MVVEPARLTKAEPPRLRRLSLGKRLRIAGGLIAELTRSDFRTAAAYVRLKYADKSFALRWLHFTVWAFQQISSVIPHAVQCLSIARHVSRTPMWLADGNPLANHPWASDPSATFSTNVDTLVIGAGFTGGALAYHWSKRAPIDRRLSVVEMDDPASGSSGRNEGLVVMGRHFMMVRDSVRRHLASTLSKRSPLVQERLAWQFAEHYCRAAYHNAELIEQTIREEQFDCDYMRLGWVQCRESSDQAALDESARLAFESGFTDWTSIAPTDVHDRTGMRVNCNAGFSAGCASWNPAKWVWCLFSRALQCESVQLFTRTKVIRVEDAGTHYLVHTDRGTVTAQHVIYATETYTPQLDRRLSGAILPMREQAACGIGGPAEMPPDVGISGSWFFAGRHGQQVIFGSGGPRVNDNEAGQNAPSRFLTKFVAAELLRLFGPYRLHMTHEWSGTTGYSPDEYPIVGSLDDKKLFVIGGMCGSGSGVSFNAARCIINRILGITDEPDDYPPEYFAPSRLISPSQHPWPECAQPTPRDERLSLRP